MRIVYSLPNIYSLQRAMLGKPEDATYVLQVPILKALCKCNHSITFIGFNNPSEVILTTDINQLVMAKPTWTGSSIFRLAEKITWQIQQLFRVPYLNVFSNLRLLDISLRHLPGHDIVYERQGLYQTGLAQAAKRLGMPYVVFFEADAILEHDYMGEPINGLLRWRAKQMMRTNFTLADCILSVSDSGKSHLINVWKVPAEKILVFPNGVDIGRFKPDAPAGLRVREDLGFQKNPLVIFVGNFFHWHDVTTLLNAFSHVLEEIPDARLLLVGDGHKRLEMEELATALGIIDAVRFTGLISHSEVPAYVNAADVAVVPYPNTNNEMWFSPLKLYEYMACGKAVVATGVGQITKVIQDHHNGILIPPEDVEAMAKAIVRLIRDEDLRLGFGQAARKDAENKYSWDQYVDRLERVFHALVSGQSFGNI